MERCRSGCAQKEGEGFESAKNRSLWGGKRPQMPTARVETPSRERVEATSTFGQALLRASLKMAARDQINLAVRFPARFAQQIFPGMLQAGQIQLACRSPKHSTPRGHSRDATRWAAARALRACRPRGAGLCCAPIFLTNCSFFRTRLCGRPHLHVLLVLYNNLARQVQAVRAEQTCCLQPQLIR